MVWGKHELLLLWCRGIHYQDGKWMGLLLCKRWYARCVLADTGACLNLGWKSALIKQGSKNLLCIINLNLFSIITTSEEQPKKAAQYVLQALLCAFPHSRQIQNVDFCPKRQVVKNFPELKNTENTSEHYIRECPRDQPSDTNPSLYSQWQVRECQWRRCYIRTL